MAIVPPDPGHALALAKTCSYDAAHRCFMRNTTAAERRFLRVENNKWSATVVPERTFSAQTYAMLQDGHGVDGNLIRLHDRLYALLDSGFEAELHEVT